MSVIAHTCPCSIWDNSFTLAGENDPNAVEVGVKFRSDQAGFITGLRFYKTSGNTGTHVGHLWTAEGTQLAEATFSGETASGWQQVSLDSPVAIDANTTYVASYHAPNGDYAASNNYFATGGFDSAPLHALGDGVDGPNGIYKYGPSGGLFSGTAPTPSSRATTGSTSSSRTPSGRTPPRRRSPRARRPTAPPGSPTGANVTATFSEPMDSDTINGTNFQLRDPSNALVPATVTYDAVRTGGRRSTPDAAAPELDHLHGDGEGRARRRHRRREPRQRPRLRLDLVLHHRGATATAARRGTGRPDPGDLERRQPVQPLLRRDPARRGTERIHRDRHLQRHAGDPERARRRDPRRRSAESPPRLRC